jgi:uncharacterized protein YrrD
MIKANDLDGRAVVDLESAKKVGYVDEIYLDTDGGRIAAYLVAEGSKLSGGGQKILMPASAVETIGPEAIMVHPIGGERVEHGDLDRLPRLSHVKGKKVVSEGGKLLGTIDDVLLADASGHIEGYTLKSASWTESLFGGNDDHPDYVRGDANLRLGEDLLVVPEDAVVLGRRHDRDRHTPDRHDPDRHETDREARRRDETPAIDSLSYKRGSTSHDHLVPPQPANVEYAEPIRRTDTASSTPVAHTERSSFAEPVVRRDADDVTSARPVDTHPVDRPEHWDDVRGRFRARWEQRTGGRGGLWEEHEPGYRYGWEMASRPDFRTRTWNTAEPELRRDWETRHHDRPWDRVMDAIRDAWDDVTGRDESDVAGYRSTRHHDEAPDAIERLSEQPMPTHRVTTTDSERLGTRRVVDEGSDTGRSLL